MVDDYPNEAESLQKWLSRLGHDVQIALDGIAGLEAAKEFLPHVIFVDILMPKLDGH